jgi:hypothetical protein
VAPVGNAVLTEAPVVGLTVVLEEPGEGVLDDKPVVPVATPVCVGKDVGLMLPIEPSELTVPVVGAVAEPAEEPLELDPVAPGEVTVLAG